MHCILRAFTQLAADNQYAHLGLALIGVLAQVNAAIAPLVSPPVQESVGAITAEQVTTPPVGPRGDPEDAGADFGVAVSRTELVTRKRLAAEDDPPAEPERNNAKQKGEDPEEDAQKTGTSDGVEVKEKSRKKKRRDEFDDIFGSLETEESSKKKKKKKSKKRDEFDDIFGSLL
jgi:ribonuclease MRP protein subunit RMP1